MRQNAIEIIRKHYIPGSPLYETLVTHSEAVARKALECLGNSRVDADAEFVYEAAMLHDIGILMTDAPSIHCLGHLPYICHGIEGRRILEAEGLPRHALVCERHTGSGLTIDNIVCQNLPLPHRDMTPQTVEERLVCYADKFFSKSGNLRAEKPIEKVMAQMAAHGEDSLARFMKMHREFS